MTGQATAEWLLLSREAVGKFGEGRFVRCGSSIRRDGAGARRRTGAPPAP
jgi:hypothetical protein